MILLEIEDFNNYFSLAQGQKPDELIQAYIDRYEESYIKRILGVELGQKFIEDIQGTDSDSSAISDRFQKLLDPFILQNSCRSIEESKGMKNILAGLIFYEIVADGQVKHSQSGMVLSNGEVSITATPQEAARIGEQKWNEALPSICAIQWYCGTEKSADYPEYQGTWFRPKYSPLL